MLAGRMILDGVGYSVHDIEVEEAGPNGQPTGKMLPVKALLIQDGHSPMQLEWRMTAEQMASLAEALLGRPQIVQANEGDLAALRAFANGGRHPFRPDT